VNVVLTIFLNPFISFFSLLVDILSLAGFLMRDETTLELKYRQSLDDFNQIKLETVMINLSRILYSDFEKKYRDKKMTVI